jgi:glutathione S-transferase
MALLVSGSQVQVQEVNLAAKPAALMLASAKGTVPVLVLGDGTVIDESLDIMRWALRIADPQDWLGAVDDDLVCRCDGPFKQAIDGYKYGADAGHRGHALAFLEGLDRRLDGRGGLCRDALGFADIAIMPFVRQCAAVDRGWFQALPLPHLQGWLAELEESALFAAIMAKPDQHQSLRA